MPPNTQTTEPDGKLVLPWDLTDWVDKEQLLHWIKDEVGSLDWSNPELLAYLKAHPDYRPKTMLCLLTYAYAIGVYESEEMVRNSYEDEVFRALCESHPPTTNAIGRFRRENRGLLKWALEQLLKRALRARYSLGDMLLPSGLRRHLMDLALERLNMARHMDRAAQGA
jgi:transposase